jgi:hypothetical protein
MIQESQRMSLFQEYCSGKQTKGFFVLGQMSNLSSAYKYQEQNDKRYAKE